MIQPAKISQLDKIHAITQACAKAMQGQGIFQWDARYPSRKVLETDLKNDQLYVYLKAGKALGCIVLTTKMDAEYQSVVWLTPKDSTNLYVHRLAVHPDFQKMGIGHQMMNYAEKFAKEKHYDSIRLDTFSQNVYNQHFYEKRGYTRLDQIFLPAQSEHPFYCYELVL